MRARIASSTVSGTSASRTAPAPAVSLARLREHAEQLLDVERDAVGPGVDRGRDVARNRQARLDQERRHPRRVLGRQAGQADFLGLALGEQPRRATIRIGTRGNSSSLR